MKEETDRQSYTYKLTYVAFVVLHALMYANDRLIYPYF